MNNLFRLLVIPNLELYKSVQVYFYNVQEIFLLLKQTDEERVGN